MFARAIEIPELIRQRSIFLFGPRQSGKTTLLRTQIPSGVFYDLLEADTFSELTRNPALIRQRLTGRETAIVIDEIQRLPQLLHEVHAMVERNKKLRFVLTGSSARSLRQGGVNLLGGRARTVHLHGLVWPETGAEYLERRLLTGSLPAVLTSEEPFEDLKAYAAAYLQKEIGAEGLVRRLEPFSRFFETAAKANGEIVNFTNVGSDAGVPPRTVREHYQLLVDTLLGTMLEPFRGSSRKAAAAAKFYLFDTGLAHFFQRRRELVRGTAEYGRALEHLVLLECQAHKSYRRLDYPIQYWRTHSGFEVDFLLGGSVAIEVKASARVTERDLKGLRALSEETTLRRRIVVSLESAPRRLDDGTEILPVTEFLSQLWAGDVIG